MLASFFLLTVAYSSELIPYVDIEKATAQVQALTRENETLKQEMADLEDRNLKLESAIENWNRDAANLNLVLERVKLKSADLAEIYKVIVDVKTKERAQAIIERNRQLKQQLDTRKADLARAVSEAQLILTSNVKLIGIKNSKISRNKDEINLLNASIEKSKLQIEVLNVYIDEVESFLDESETILGTTATDILEELTSVTTSE